jgi:ATP-dependent Clp protease ATP-binding subunit ClpB
MPCEIMIFSLIINFLLFYSFINSKLKKLINGDLIMAEEILGKSTKSRLKDIDEEINLLKEKHKELYSRWEQEKKYIKKIQDLKESIEQQKVLADKYERQGDLGKVAEIRYGTIIEFEKQLKQANDRLNQIQEQGTLLKEEVDAEDIAEIVAKWTGIPVSKMMESERIKLIKMEDRIHQRLIGQEEAVSSVANAIRRSRAGLQDKNRPVGSFIFIGTTGVGKTELARSLAEFLFDDENALVRIDMSEYMEKYSVSRLIGAPPGYVGYEEGGQLTEAVRQRPYSVVLLDEIEKANPEVFNVLLQMLDDGRLTDGKGRTVNFTNTIIIMTSNLGTEIIQDRISEMNNGNRDRIMSDVRVEIIELLRKNMRPEFLNRIDEIILFKPLTKEEIAKIALLQIDHLKAKTAKLGIKLDITDNAIDWLSKIGYNVQYGARPLKRVIQKYIADPLALKLLSSDFKNGDTIRIIADKNGKFVFTKT